VPGWLRAYVRETRVWKYVRSTRTFRRVNDYLQISLCERVLSWFVHRIMQGTRHLPCTLHFTSRITVPKKLVLGKGVALSLAKSGGLYIQAGNGVEIGDETIIAPGVKIISSNHRFEDYGEHVFCEPIRIGRRCWLGVNAVILPGVQLGDEVIVGAGAVVTRSFPPRCVIAGVPADIIKTLPPAGTTDKPQP